MRDFVHVDDVAAANLAAVEADRGGFAAFNVCSGRPISILEVARLVCRCARRPGAAGHRCSTAAATSGTSSPTRPWRRRCSDSGRHRPADGLREFAFAPLRA